MPLLAGNPGLVLPHVVHVLVPVAWHVGPCKHEGSCCTMQGWRGGVWCACADSGAMMCSGKYCEVKVLRKLVWRCACAGVPRHVHYGCVSLWLEETLRKSYVPAGTIWWGVRALNTLPHSPSMRCDVGGSPLVSRCASRENGCAVLCMQPARHAPCLPSSRSIDGCKQNITGHVWAPAVCTTCLSTGEGVWPLTLRACPVRIPAVACWSSMGV